MDDSSVFDRLVRELSPSQRRDLIDRVRSLSIDLDRPLVEEEAPREAVDIDRYYRGLGVMARLILFLKRLLTGRGIAELAMENLLSGLAREVQTLSPGMFDFRRALFLPSFFSALKSLRQATHVFQGPLARATGRRRPGFVAFYARMAMEDLHDRLETETRPSFHAGPGSSVAGEVLPDQELRRRMEAALEDALHSLSRDDRARMYADIRFVDRLAALCSFPLDSLLGAAGPVAETAFAPVPFDRLSEKTMELADVFHGLKIVPSSDLFRALFYFAAQDQFDEDRPRAESWLAGEVTKGRESFDRIRAFSRQVPLVRLCSYLARDPAFTPSDPSGGEDWLAAYRVFWRARMERQLKDFSIHRRRVEITKELTLALEATPLESVRGYPDSETPASARFSLSAATLKSCCRLFVEEFNRPLKALLTDGKFYKEDNRAEFRDTYAGLLRLRERIPIFEANPNDRDAEAMVKTGIELLMSLRRVINGILHGEFGGRYDTLSNLSDLGGRNNQAYLRTLDTILVRSARLGGVLDKSYQLEATS